jgi:hypothetical protein
MTFTIPVWLMWVVCIPLGLVALFLMLLGAAFLYFWSK